MTAFDLLAGLKAKGVRIERVDDRLRISAPKGAINAEERQALTHHKAELMALLAPADGCLDALDRSVIRAIRDNELIPLGVALGSAGSAPGVPNGWTRSSWINRLRQLADRCERVNPGRATELRDEAGRIDAV